MYQNYRPLPSANLNAGAHQAATNFPLIGISVAVCFLGAFLWATKSGQYEDTYTPGVRMLFEEEGKEHEPPV